MVCAFSHYGRIDFFLLMTFRIYYPMTGLFLFVFVFVFGFFLCLVFFLFMYAYLKSFSRLGKLSLICNTFFIYLFFGFFCLFLFCFFVCFVFFYNSRIKTTWKPIYYYNCVAGIDCYLGNRSSFLILSR